MDIRADTLTHPLVQPFRPWHQLIVAFQAFVQMQAIQNHAGALIVFHFLQGKWRLLLDTQIYLWYLAASRKLPKSVLDGIEIAEVVYISAASVWEAGVKINQGKLQVKIKDLVAGIASSGFVELPMTASHSALAASHVGAA